MRLPALLVMSVLVIACGPPGPGPDEDAWTGLDAGTPIEVDAGAELDAPDALGGTCSDDGLYYCMGYAAGVMCCGGRWSPFVDDPCRSPYVPDGGAPTCDAAPSSPGCPCAEEGASMCRPFRPSVVCTGGAWVESLDHWCCT